MAAINRVKSFGLIDKSVNKALSKIHMKLAKLAQKGKITYLTIIVEPKSEDWE